MPWYERVVPERFRGTRWDPGPRGVVVLAVVAVLAVVLAGMVALREEPEVYAVPPIGPLTSAGPVSGAAPDGSGGAGGVGAKAENGPGGSGPGPQGQPGADEPASSRYPAAPGPSEVNGHPASTGELVVSVIGFVEYGGLRRLPAGSRVADALKSASPRPDADLSALNLAQPLTDGDQIVVGKPAPRPQQIATTILNSAKPPSTATAPTSTRPATPAAKINLNTATEAELDALPGVGPITAKSIVTWRTTHGRFTSIDQLADIDGIGPARLARLRASVTI
ncbi:ComEA family DNA-binding protein [Nocardia sp. NPDC055321]